MFDLRTSLNSYFPLPEKDLNTLLGLFKTRSLKKGAFFLKSGQLADQLAYIN